MVVSYGLSECAKLDSIDIYFFGGKFRVSGQKLNAIAFAQTLPRREKSDLGPQLVYTTTSYEPFSRYAIAWR